MSNNKFWLGIWSLIVVIILGITFSVVAYKYYTNVLLVKSNYTQIRVPINYTTIWVKESKK